MGGELPVEALILRPVHDDEHGCEQHDDDGAERACHPGDRPKKARAFARWIEEYRLAKHGRFAPSGSRDSQHTPRLAGFTRQSLARSSARTPHPMWDDPRKLADD